MRLFVEYDGDGNVLCAATFGYRETGRGGERGGGEDEKGIDFVPSFLFILWFGVKEVL